MNKINLFWHKVPFGKKNFGDVLGPFIVGHLTGRKVVYTPLLHTEPNKLFVLTYLRAIYNRKLSVKEMFQNVQYLMGKRPNLLITIGSVIDWYTNPNCDIWGSGIMKRNSKITKANFYAVRGEYTQLRLQELGYEKAPAIGDPALLTPIIYTPETKEKYSLGIIPHFLHYEETVKRLKHERIKVINLLDDIESVIDQVASCEKIISSSLHGIIIAHAYDVPALWFWMSQTHIGGDDIKFADYFSSVDIEEYKIFKLKRDEFDSDYLMKINNIFNDNLKLTLVASDVLKKIQNDLLNNAPFPVLQHYKNLIKN